MRMTGASITTWITSLSPQRHYPADAYEYSPAEPGPARELPDLQPLQEMKPFVQSNISTTTDGKRQVAFFPIDVSLSTLASESSSCSTFDTPNTYKRFYNFPRAEPITIAKSQTAFSALPQCILQQAVTTRSSCQARAKGWNHIYIAMKGPH